MSQDAPPVSRKEKKAQRDAERRQQGKKRKHAETIEDEAPLQSQAQEEDFVPLAIGDALQEKPTSTAVKSTKRKRREEDATDIDASQPESAAPKPKKQKKAKGEASATEDGETGTPTADDKSIKSRFILFIGNLPYNTTDASLEAHFKKLAPFTLRHRTDPKTKKSKGFAFLEFENYDRMKTCLKLYHHSMFDPAESTGAKGNGKGARRINVELTAGGGGKAEGRKDKIRVKNVRLEEQRKRRLELEMKEKAKAGRKGGAAGKRQARPEPEVNIAPAEGDAGGMHPSRLARMKG